ncbi:MULTISPECIES: helix-turn-helix domain-containing protein [Paenibacillus]|uniref:helix-turn-helix domain-containing protein n=1 Tax=Paenibacillus TaxID=44249 RepID=UPI001FC8FFD6|nr:helix-turn-helix transcriptional regulator [Paenibacillus rhizosphaerae]
MDCSKRSVGELENGEKAPSMLTVTALAKALQAKPLVFIKGYGTRWSSAVYYETLPFPSSRIPCAITP